MNRPAKLTTVCIISIILAGAGILTSLSALGAMVVPKTQMFPNNFPEKDKKFVEAQKQMMQSMETINRQYRTYQAVLSILVLLVSAAILICSIMTMQMKESAAKVLPFAFLAAVPIDIGRTIVGALLSHKMSGVMIQYMHQMLQTGSPSAKQLPNMDGIMSNFMQVFSGLAVVFGIVWTAAKVGFYIYSALYLRKAQTQQLFLPVPIPTPPPLPR
jgi:hypothetical protein